MAENSSFEACAKTMSHRDFTLLSEYVHSHCGIKMPPVKKIMLEARLQKRLRSLGIPTFREYCDYLFKNVNGPDERIHMINAVTTNKTDFFREPGHFKFLAETVLPEFALRPGSLHREFTVWSAGCSTGEEPYTIAMTISEFASSCPGFRSTILATDISTKVLEKAKLGIYDRDRTATVSPQLRQKYFLRSKDRSKGLVRIVPELRSLVRFQKLNLMDKHFLMSTPPDAIFCRNVMIYFNSKTQEKLVNRLGRCLRRGGYLFLGHSESLHGFSISLERIAATIYRKTA